MSRKKQKYYVVWKGRHPGIYLKWEECQKQIANFPGAQYKSYRTKEEAEIAFSQGPSYELEKKMKGVNISHLENPDIINNSWCVDAACSGNPGIMEYRAVDLMTDTEIFKRGPYKSGTNNIGEFLAIVHAAALLNKLEDESKVIYTDSRTALSWVRKAHVNTKLKRTKQNDRLFSIVERAIRYLKANPIKNPLLKWETAEWGEIPADFGRK